MEIISRFALPLRRQFIIASTLVFIWPFLYLYKFVIPDQSFSLSFGNDFGHLYYNYKVYLLDFLSRHWRIPLWSPSEAAGFPFHINPFTQALYPLNIPLALYYSVTGGYSYHDHQLFTVLGVSIYALGMFLWLAELGMAGGPAFVTTIIVSVSFKITETLRFPNAIHTAAWMPWLLLGLTRSLVKRSCIAGPLIAGLSVIMIVTGGYPYYAYYTIFLAAPYALLLIHPGGRTMMTGSSASKNIRPPVKNCCALALALAAAAIVCVPYIQGIRSLLRLTVDRGGDSFEFSTTHTFSPIDSLGALVFPPASQAEGWYYFSIPALILVIAYLFSALLNRHHYQSESRFILAILTWCGLITLITYGKSSPVFRAMWAHFPLFAQLRVWSRLNIVMAPLIALLLCRSLIFLEQRLSTGGEENDKMPLMSQKQLLTLISLAYALILVAQLALYGLDVRDRYWIVYFVDLHGRELRFIWFGFISFLILSGSVFFVRRTDFLWRRRLKTVWATLLITLAAADMIKVGSRQWAVEPISRQGDDINVPLMMAFSLHTQRKNAMTTIALSPEFHVGLIENWYFRRYVDFYNRVYTPVSGAAWDTQRVVNEAEEPWFKILLGIDDGRRLFFSRGIEHHSIRGFIADSRAIENAVNIIVDEYTGDELQVSVDSTVPGYLSFIDNDDGNWRVYVNNERRVVEHLFDTFKSVNLSPGHSIVRFVYAPQFFRWLGNIRIP